MKSVNALKDQRRGECDRKVQWRAFYRNMVLAIILFSAATTASAGETSADTLSLLRISNTYSPVSGIAHEIQNDKSETELSYLVRKAHMVNYSLRDNDYTFPDTHFGKFFEKLSKNTKPQIEAARDNLLYCDDKPECYSSLSAEQGKVFTKNATKALVLALTEENKTIRYAYEKMENIESYFTAYIVPGDKKIYNPILSPSGAGMKSTDYEVRKDRKTIRFSLKYRVNQGMIGEIKIPARIIDMNVGHEISSNKTMVLITFPFSDNVQLEAVRKRDNQYVGTIQINHPTERFEEIINNLFDSGHIIL